jgi:hypothetical protein
MSSVKLHLPFYDDKILTSIMDLMNDVKNINIINIDKIRSSDPDKTYKKVGELIFDNYHQKNIILGHYTKHPLPIPDLPKIIIKELVNKSTKTYEQYGYMKVEKKNLIDNLKEMLLTLVDTHTFTIKLNGKLFSGDVFHLWYLSHFNKKDSLKTSDFIEKVYKGQDIEKVKFWNKLYIKDLKKFPDEYERVEEANMMHPVIVVKVRTSWTMLDGYHRLVNAYKNKKKNIKVRFVTLNQILKTEINKKKFDESLNLVITI